MLPNRTQDFKKNTNNSGFKKQKDWITLLFTGNKIGSHKLKLFLKAKTLEF